MFKNLTNTQIGIALSATAFSLFAFGDVFIKYLGAFYSPVTIAFYTALSVLIMLITFAKPLGGFKNTFKNEKILLHIVRAALFSTEFLLIIYAFSKLPMATCYAVIFTAPFIATLLAIPVLKILPKKAEWIAIISGFIGVLIILRPGLIPVTLPVIGLLIGAFCFAGVNVLVRLIDDGKQTLLSWAIFTEIFIVISMGAFYLLNPEILTLAHLGMIVLLGLFSFGALIMIGQAFIYAAPSVAAPFQYIQILWGILFGYFVFGDKLDLWTGIGATIIVISGIWLVSHQKAPAIKDSL